MSPEQKEELQLFASGQGYRGFPSLVQLVQVLLELVAKVDDLANVAHYHFRAPGNGTPFPEMKERRGDSHEYLRDHDGGADPIGRCAEPTAFASSILDHVTASATSPALTNDGTIDVCATAEHYENRAAQHWLDAIDHEAIARVKIKPAPEGENRGDGAAQASISGSQTRARVRDDLEALIRDYPLYRVAPDDKGAPVVLDRILDRLIEEARCSGAAKHVLLQIKHGALSCNL